MNSIRSIESDPIDFDPIDFNDKGSNWYIGFMRSLIASPKAKDTKLKIIDFCSKK